MSEQEVRIATGTELKRLRLEKTPILSAREIALAVKMDPGTYNRTEQGTRDITLPEIYNIAEYYLITPMQLLSRITRSQQEITEIKKLEFELEEALQENKWLRDKLAETKKEIG